MWIDEGADKNASSWDWVGSGIPDDYLKDSSGLSAPAEAFVFVKTAKQVQEIVLKAQKHRLPIICRGAGTNVVGACVPEEGGIILSFEKMNKVLEINAQNMTARVEPGVVLGDFQRQVEDMGLYFPPDPSALNISTIGGGLAQASAGARTFKYGGMKDYVLGLTVVTADGRIMKTGSDTIKNAAGYNLTSLFVGSEGTLGIIVEATLKLIPKPQHKQVCLAFFDTTEAAIDAVGDMIKLRPSVIDFMDKNALAVSGLAKDKQAALLIEFDEPAQINLKDCRVSKNEHEYEEIWAARRSSWDMCAKLKPNVTTDDVIVPRENLGKLVGGIREICERHNLISCLIGHVGDGSVHPQIPVDFEDADECARLGLAKEEIYELTRSLGGTISGEHGIGILKRPYLGKFTDPLAMEYMRAIKKVFDPDNILNPGKIFTNP